MLAFLGGIVLTNLLGANQQIHGQLLNQTFLQQYAYQKVDGNQLFGHVVMVRMQMLVLIFLLGRAVDGKVFSVLAKEHALSRIRIPACCRNYGIRRIWLPDHSCRIAAAVDFLYGGAAFLCEQ